MSDGSGVVAWSLCRRVPRRQRAPDARTEPPIAPGVLWHRFLLPSPVGTARTLARIVTRQGLTIRNRGLVLGTGTARPRSRGFLRVRGTLYASGSSSPR